MTHSERLLRLPETFRRLTGITPDAFRTLLAQLERAWLDARRRRGERPGRRRKPGAGRKHANALAERLLMLLIYYRTYVSHASLGLLFSLDPGNVSKNIAALEPLLAGIFRIPERRVEVKEDEVRELFFDGTERPTRRPRRGQRAYYSGKKKRHTLKNQVVVVREKKRPGRREAGAPPQKRRQRIAAVSGASPGRVHDKKVYDRARTLIPPGVPATGDTGYKGTGLRSPAKKRAGGRADAPAEARERADQPEAYRGRARDREDEDLAYRGGEIPQPLAATHLDHQERRRPAQHGLRMRGQREGAAARQSPPSLPILPASPPSPIMPA